MVMADGELSFIKIRRAHFILRNACWHSRKPRAARQQVSFPGDRFSVKATDYRRQITEKSSTQGGCPPGCRGGGFGDSVASGGRRGIVTGRGAPETDHARQAGASILCSIY